MRETGPARKDLTGDDAAAYVGPARTLLGKLKNDMSFNNLSQGQRTQDMPDGTRIVVTSMFGRDKVSVVTAAGVTLPIDIQAEEAKSLPVVHEDDAELEGFDIQSVVICGNSVNQLDPNGDLTTTVVTAWVFQPGKNIYTTIQNLGIGTICNSISDDGRTIVGGTFKDVPGLGQLPQPTVWKNGAATLLPTGLDPALASSYGMATDVSKDGKVIVGGLWFYGVLPRSQYYNAVWINGALAAIFPALAGYDPGGGTTVARRYPGQGILRTPCVSPDGKVLGLFGHEAVNYAMPGNTFPVEWSPITQYNQTWALGSQNQGAVSMGAPIPTGKTYQTSIYETFSLNTIQTFTLPMPAAPACVEDNGNVVGLGEYLLARIGGNMEAWMTPTFSLDAPSPGFIDQTTSRASRIALNAVGSSAKGRTLFVTTLTSPSDGWRGECVVYNGGVAAATLGGKFVLGASRDGTLVGGYSSEGGEIGLVTGGWQGKPMVMKPIQPVWGGKDGGMSKQLTPPGGPIAWVADIGKNAITFDPPPGRLDR